MLRKAEAVQDAVDVVEDVVVGQVVAERSAEAGDCLWVDVGDAGRPDGVPPNSIGVAGASS